MFEIKNVSKKYNSEYALRDINLKMGEGLNFIIGSSGSGKSTLLKILSGMDNEFEGDALYLGESIKNLSEGEKSYYYNNNFGFIWQDFNLIEDMTVEENVQLPLHLKNIKARNEVMKVLKRLKLTSLKDKKVKLLSGGQKQRVAIARELVKNPKVIIADEPTSALDRKNAEQVIEILKALSKERTVIIVTHDTSLIDENSKVYELDKGELISKPEDTKVKTEGKKQIFKSKFTLKKALNVGSINIKSKISRAIVSSLSIIVSTVLLMISLGGSISDSGEKTFNKLFEQYGNSILDINIAKSFMGAVGISGDEDDEPETNVDQNISGLYEKYINDPRVDYILYNRSFSDIKIEVEDKEYKVENSGTVPTANKIIIGGAPKNKGEVVVPESFVKKMGISNEEAMGKEIDFSGGIYDWSTGEPVLKDVNVKAKIVGVADTTVKYENVPEFEIEDSFFFDIETLNDVNKQAKMDSEGEGFVMRAKDPKSLIELKNDLNAQGIVPIGQFELVEDIVKLDSQTKDLSKGSTIIISVLSILALVSISLVTSIMRKREYAIYKVCGYSKAQLSLVVFAESMIMSVVSAVVLVVSSPLISIITKMAFGRGIANISILSMGVLISVVLGFVLYIVSSIIAKITNTTIVLKSA